MSKLGLSVSNQIFSSHQFGFVVVAGLNTLKAGKNQEKILSILRFLKKAPNFFNNSCFGGL
jgi:hypothetical protein